MTFGSILQDKNGIAPGFDFLRLFLATAVVIWHSIYYTQDHSASVAMWDGTFGPLINGIVPCFFALSGFLVTGSMIRLDNLRAFITFRALRIIPALLTEIVISAILLGPLVTEWPLASYFTNAEFFSYFTNVIGIIRYQLPGVFQHQIYDQVNGALWTVPGEMVCYLTLVALTICGITRYKHLVLAAFVVGTVALYLWTRKFGAFSTQEWIPLVLCFYAGSLLYHYRDRVPSAWFFAVTAAISVYAVMRFRFGLYILVGPIMFAYLICWLGMQRLPRVKYLMDGDHSYGIYLYHCPIIQTTIWIFGGTLIWWQAWALGYPIVVLISMLSWRYVEKPALSLRKKFAPRSSATNDGTTLHLSPTSTDFSGESPARL